MTPIWIQRLTKCQNLSKAARPTRGGRPRLRVEGLEERAVPSGDPPVGSPIPRQVVNEDAAALTLNLANFFTDPENDPLTYSIVQTNSAGLVTPTISGSELTLAFAPNQFGYSYMRVTANDGTGSTTTGFEVLVREVNDLVDDLAATAKSAAVAINVLANDGALDVTRLAEAANIHVVQNDTGNNETSVTLSLPQRTPEFQLRSGSSRADYNVQIGSTGADDVAGGLLFSTVRENGRDNGETGTFVGTRFVTSAIDSTAAGYWVPVTDASDGGEYNEDPAAAYFDFRHGWVGAWAVNAAETNGGPNDLLRTFTPNSGFTIGTTTANLVRDLGSGRIRVSIPGVNSQTDGLLMAVGGKNEDNFSLILPNADGSWQVNTKDNGSNGTGLEQDYTGFVYIPRGMPNVVSGRILGDGSVQMSSGTFTVTKTGVGTYTLSIPGHSPTSGVLLLTPEGGVGNNVDNFVTYQASGNDFVIQSRDIVNTTTTPALEDVGNTTPMASFAFIPFLNIPAIRTTSAQSPGGTANQSELGATLTVNPDGTVGYDPATSTTIQGMAPGTVLFDTFRYTTISLTGQSTTATVTVTVGDGNIVNLASGTLSITSAPGISSNLSVSFDGTNYTFTDPAAIFSLTQSAINAGITGAGTNTIVVPAGVVTSLNINAGDLDDAITIANTLTLSGDVTVVGATTITTTPGAKIITPTGAVTLAASNGIGTAANNVRTRAASVVANGGAGGVFLTEDDGATVTATATGGGDVIVTNVAGTLTVSGSTATGNIVLTSGDAIHLGGTLDAGSGTITIAANTDGIGAEGYDQQTGTILTTNTGIAALTITVNTAAGGTGSAFLGRGSVGTAAGGTATVTAHNASILWSGALLVPDIGTSNSDVLRARDYEFVATGAGVAIGSAAAPIQTDNLADLATANLTAGTGGIFLTDWGTLDLEVQNAVAQGAGNIQLISANAAGHNLSVLNATTGSGNITLIADDDLFIGTLNGAPTMLPGTVGGPAFSGTISMLANRDAGNEQRIIMRPNSLIQTSNATANAIRLAVTANDNDATNATLGGITLAQVTAGDGGTITLDVSPNAASEGNIIQNDATTTVNAGPTGTVVLHAANLLNAGAPASAASIGTSTTPIRTAAGTVQVSSTNTPVWVTSTGPARFAAAVTANGAATVAGATLDLSTVAGVLTVGGATHTDGGPVTLTGAGGIAVTASLGDANTGNFTANAGANDIVFTANLTVNAGQTVTLTDGNLAQLGPITTVNGTLVAANGVAVGSGGTLQGNGTVTGPVTVASGGTVSPGTAGVSLLNTGALTLGGTLAVDLNGTAPGAGFDQVNVTGAVDLTGSTLNVGVGFVPNVGDTFAVINNDGTDPITGTFGTSFPLTAGRGVFTVSYAGGTDNNDVVLMVANLRPVANFTPVTPNPRPNGVPSIEITFSEAVTGFDVADLTLTRAGSVVPLTGVTISGTGAVYTINGLDTLTEAPGTYTLTLTAAGSNIQDLDTPVGTLFGDAAATWVRTNTAAPVLDNTGDMVLGSILEDAVASTGTLITDLIASAGGDRITDADPGGLEGVAIVAADIANGTWQFSINSGVAWSPLGPVSATASRLLASDAATQVRFTPNADFNGSIVSALTFRAWDQSAGVNGGTADASTSGGATAFSADTETASFVVTPVNDAPSFIKGPDQSAAEDAGSQTVAAWATAVSAGPANESGQALTFEISTNNNALFSALPAIDASGNLTYTPAANATGSATVTVRLKDNGGTTGGGQDTSPDQTFTITLTPVNDAPTNSLPSTFSATEDTPLALTGISVIDVDAGSASVRVTLAVSGGTLDVNTGVAGGVSAGDVSGDGTATVVITAPLTAINATLAAANGLLFAPAHDFFGGITLTVTTDDQGNTGSGGAQSDTDTAAISVAPVNDAPVLGDYSFAVQAGAVVGQLVGTVTATDVENDTVAYAITAGDPGGNFAIDASGNITVASVAGLSGTFTLTVTATDSGTPNLSDTGTVTVLVNTAPVSNGIPNVAAEEDAATPISIDLGAAFDDAEEPDTDLIFTVQSNSNPGLFGSTNITGTTLFLTPAADAFGNSSITVRATDSAGAFAEATFTATVNPVNDAPTLDAPADVQIDEDAPEQTVILTGITAGPANEANQTLSVTAVSSNPTLVPNPTATFVAGTGWTLNFTPVADATGSATITVTVTDSGGTGSGGIDATSETFDITVGSQDDRPVVDTAGTPMLPAIPVLGRVLPNGGLIADLTEHVSDVDAGALAGVAVIAMDNTKGKWQFNLTGNDVDWADIPAVSATNALLLADDGNTRVRFIPSRGFTGFANLTFKAWDQSNGAAEGTFDDTTAVGDIAYSTASDRGWIAVGKTKPPVTADGATALPAVKEDSKALRVALVKNLLGIAGLESAPKTNLGIAIIAVNPVGGTWQYRLAKTKTWVDVGAVSTTQALLLRPTDQVRFVHAANADGEGTLTFKTWDQTTGTPGAKVDTAGAAFGVDPGTAVLDLIPVNDAPLLDLTKAAVLNPVSAGQTTNEAAFSSLMSATDVEGAVVGVAIVKATGQGTWEFKPAGGNWTLLPTVSAGKAMLLGADAEVRFTAAAGATAGSAALSFKAWDRTTGTTGAQVPARGSAFSAGTEILTVAVANTAPTLDVSGSPTFTPVKAGAKPASGDAVSKLLGPRGAAITDPDLKALKGIAITAVDNTNGTWQYSLGGNKWVDVGPVTKDAALLLTDRNRLRFVPAAGFTGTASIQFVAWDRTAGQAGDRIDTDSGLNSFSAEVETATVTVGS